MGMNADIIATGKFRKKLAKYLDYPKDYYEGVPTGSWIITSLFHCPTTTTSEFLARALRIDPWKLGEHRLFMLEVYLGDLRKFAQDHNFEKDYEAFLALLDSGFTFYYRPNG